MILYPAIDIYNGRAVRLIKGNFSQVTDYGDPYEVALQLQRDGASHVHIVDLNAAKGDGDNLTVIEKIAETGLNLQVGGGARDAEQVQKRLDCGVMRVVIGTVCVKDPSASIRILQTFGDRVIFGFDSLNGRVAVDGWQSYTNDSVEDLCARYADYGLNSVICTDIDKDGSLSGVNTRFFRDLTSAIGMEVIASGGITTLKDLHELKKCGVYGVIVGKALYEKRFTLKEAMEACK